MMKSYNYVLLMGHFFFVRELLESSSLELTPKENKLLQTHTYKRVLIWIIH